MNQFNALNLPDQYLKKNWNTLYPISSYVQSSKDNNHYEAAFKGMNEPVFPIPTSAIAGQNKGLIRTTPYGNTLTVDFAKEVIKQEKMGQQEDADFLTISFSSTDYIGHRFGANAIETEDTYLRLDKDLESLFQFLDLQVGEGDFTVFLTADHAAAHNVTFLQDNHIPSGLWDAGKAEKALNNLLEAEFGQKNLILGFHNFQLNLNIPALKKAGISELAVKTKSIDYLKELEGVAYAIDMTTSQTENIPAELKEKIAKGFNTERSGGVQVVLLPGWYFGTGTTGTTHGTWYPYDTHIPLLFMGWGVKQGHLKRNTNMTDIAATMAALLNIQTPNGTIGKPITELLIP